MFGRTKLAVNFGLGQTTFACKFGPPRPNLTCRSLLLLHNTVGDMLSDEMRAEYLCIFLVYEATFVANILLKVMNSITKCYIFFVSNIY